jgi:hypothetical protein
MQSPGMLRRVALVRTDVSEDTSASIVRVTRIDELGTTLAVTSNRRMLRRNTSLRFRISGSPILVTLMMEALDASKTSILTRVRRRKIPKDDIHPYENRFVFPAKRFIRISRFINIKLKKVTPTRNTSGFR